MNLPLAILTIRWLAWDTFRQALSSGIFWLMLTVTGICTLFCSSAGVKGGSELFRPGEQPEFLPRGDKRSEDVELLRREGVDVVSGTLTMGFGALELPLGRDPEQAVRVLELVLAGGVADAAGLLLALMWTAGFIPTFLEANSASVLLAKPVPRWSLLIGKYAGVLVFVGFQSLLFVGCTWTALGLTTGQWIPEYWLCVPLLLVHFAVMYSVSVLIGVTTRNTVAAVFGSIVFWLICWGLNFGRHSIVALPILDPNIPQIPGSIRWLVDVMYWALPKPADMSIILDKALHAGVHFATIPAFEKVQELGAFNPEMSVLSSLAFAVVMLYLSARQLGDMDY